MNRGWHTIVCVATGPSFSEHQATLIEAARAAGKCRVIAINDSWRRLPHADVLYACDGKWFDVHLAGIRASGFAGEIWTQSPRAAPGYVPRSPRERPALLGLNYIVSRPGAGLSTDSGSILDNKNGGAQGAGLAVHFGGRQLILVGYDMQATARQTHFFGDHPAPLSNNLSFAPMIRSFEVLARDLKKAGVDCINSTSQTALTCFRTMPLEEALR